MTCSIVVFREKAITRYPELRQPPSPVGKLVAFPVLGGVQHDYRLVAWAGVCLQDEHDDRSGHRCARPLEPFPSCPELALSATPGLVIIDEIQRMPKLFEVLRVLVDREGTPERFPILGSAPPQLIEGVSESLAGRVEFVDLAGLWVSMARRSVATWML